MSSLSTTLKTPLLVTLAAAALYLPFYGSFGLLDPWEPHYGEAARNMVESGDWISPWWGSYWPEGEPCSAHVDCAEDEVCEATRAEFLNRPATCRPKDIEREGAYFFSKPVLSMWMMAIGMSALGVNPWGVRLLFVLFALYAVFLAAYTLRRFFSDRVSILGGAALATSPFFAILSRQSVTDMPFVAPMIAGTCHLMLAMFLPDDESEKPAHKPFRWFLVAFGLLAIPQMLLLLFRLDVLWPIGRFRIMVGPLHAGLYACCAAVFIFFARKAPNVRKVHLYAFYALIGLAMLGKGLLGLALPGAAILLYLVVNGDWRQLKRVELLRGPLVFIAVGFPWYGAMFARHFRGFYDRFIIHDHFKRLGSGVHQIDSGAFDHFILWLGLGTFPWSAFIPAAIGWELVRRFKSDEPARGPDAVRLFVVLWFLLTFTLFTVSSTKFHHYIFPAVGPAALMLAIFLDELDRRVVPNAALVVAAALGLYAIQAWALTQDPQRIINLVTYMYDRKWPPEIDYRRFLTVVSWAGALPFAAWIGREAWPPGRRLGSAPLYGVVAVAVFFSGWTIDRYLPGIQSTWSQQPMFDAYDAACTPTGATYISGRPICEERIASYKMNWRGETFHSDNGVVPLRDDDDLKHFLTTDDGKRTFYALVEYSRLNNQFKAKLPADRRDLVQRLFEENVKFLLVKVPAAPLGDVQALPAGAGPPR